MQVDPSTADIVVMGSFRAHFDPSRPLNLEAGVAAAPATAAAANRVPPTGAQGCTTAGTALALAGATGRISTNGGSLNGSTAAAAGLGAGGFAPKGAPSVSANGYIASSQTDSLRQLLGNMPLEAGGSDEKLRNGLLRQERPSGPIIEECPSGDMDAVGPRGPQGAHVVAGYGGDAGGGCPAAAVLTAGQKLLANGTAAAAAAALMPGAAATAATKAVRQQPIVELAGSLPSLAPGPEPSGAPAGDTEMEDAQAASAHHLEGKWGTPRGWSGSPMSAGRGRVAMPLGRHDKALRMPPGFKTDAPTADMDMHCFIQLSSRRTLDVLLAGPALPIAAAYATAAATAAAATDAARLPYQPHQPHPQHHHNHNQHQHQPHSTTQGPNGVAGLEVVPFGTPGIAAAAGAAASRAMVVSANALQVAPRPRSEWELDPAKIVLGRRLAVGGFGEVFVAKYEGTLVAVKRLLATDSGGLVGACVTGVVGCRRWEKRPATVMFDGCAWLCLRRKRAGAYAP